jgi:putative heme-binding domain-containing protein
VGPDLGALGNKTVQTLLVAVLDPNQAIESRYISYTAVTKNERELTGVISSETPTSITVKAAGGTEETVLRNDLVSLTSSGLSLMPEGLEKALNHQAMADLIAYLNAK